MAGTERALPGPGPVVRLGELQGGVLGHERAGAVPGQVAADDAEPDRGLARLGQQRLGVGEGRGRPGGVRMEAAPLVEQHALRPLEHGRPGAQQPSQVPAINQRHPVREGTIRVAQKVYRRPAGRPELVAQPVSKQTKRPGQRAGRGAVRHPRRVARPRERVPGGLADPHPAGAVPAPAPGHLPGPVGGLVIGRDEQGVAVHGEPVERVGDARRGQVGGLGGQRQRIDKDEARQVRPHPGGEAARAELREGVMPSVRGQDVVRRLRAAVEPDHRAGRVRAARIAQEVDDRPLALVPEAAEPARRCSDGRPGSPGR